MEFNLFRFMGIYFAKRQVVHIAGPHNAGIPVFLKDYITHSLTKIELNGASKPKFFYIDTERRFPKKLLAKELPAHYFKNNIFVNVVSHGKSMVQGIKTLLHTPSMVRPGDYVIINSISEHIKKKMAKNQAGYHEWKYEVNQMKNYIVPVLKQLLARKKINLMLIHHVSYSPGLDKNVPYYAHLFDTIKGLWLNLSEKGKIGKYGKYGKIGKIFEIDAHYVYTGQAEYGEICEKRWEKTIPYNIVGETMEFPII